MLTIGVPSLLNFFLQLESPIKSVIGGQNAPNEWLLFWGSYLAAIGSITAASVALYNERKNRKRAYYQHCIDQSNAEYYRTEKEIRDLMNLYSLSRLTNIVWTYKNDQFAALNEQKIWFSSIVDSVLLAERYFDQDFDSDFLLSFRKVNEYYIMKAEEVGEILTKTMSNRLKQQGWEILNRWIKQVSDDTYGQTCHDRFQSECVNVLHHKRTKIIHLNETLKKLL